MKSKILGVLAVGLLSGPMSAQAAFIYSLEGTFFSGLSVDFTLTVDELITSSTTFPISDFDSFNGLPLAVSVSFLGPLTSQPEILFNTLVGTDGFFWTAPWPSPGTYCAGLGGCDGRTAAVMTITEVTRVPEPGTLTLLGLGLFGLGLTRRRANQGGPP